jgi:hypothetical protein
MTIIIGVLGEGGVVVGADSSATFSAGQLRTVEQPTKKIYNIDAQIIIATTGPIGLGDRFVAVVEKNYKEKAFLNNSLLDVSKKICKEALQDFDSTFVLKMGTLNFGALMACHCGNKPCLVEFELGTLQPEIKDENLWYVSMGSGQAIADPFLGLMRRVFCPNAPPKLSTAIFMTAWALEHTIDVNPGGIKEPLQLAVLKRDEKGKLRAELLSDDALAEHKDNVKAAYAHLSGYADSLSGKMETPPLPKPPP